jgi:hypothetical protein
MISSLRKLARPWAVVFILANLLNLLAPTISWALTSGPTAPEATSFEPVDTTDMVNLATGDFTYNIPLLEVPGPAGGYPLSLSYHAGIQPNEDASWVGLGWTLNPGAISRSVNGYPDDQLGAVRKRNDYNAGSERSTFSVGVGVAGATFNLSISNDSNLGLGVGTSMSVGTSFGVGGKHGGIGINASVGAGNDGYGNSYEYGDANAGATFGGKGWGGGIGFGTNGAQGQIGLTVAKGTNSASVGVSTNFQTVGGFVGLSNGTTGVSISSNGLKASMSVAGFSIQTNNSRAGNVTTESWGISTPPIPIGPFTLTLGYNYVRYYSDETNNVNVIGTLNASSTNGKNPDDWSFDSYALLDPDAEGGVIKNNDPDKSKGGSFPAYDSYQVNAQGLGGSIQPYIFDKGTLFRQNLKKPSGSGYIIKFLGPSASNYFEFNNPVKFRFKNDFSNSLSYESANLRVNSIGGIAVQTEATTTPSEGYNAGTSHLAGSKHVEYFTNQQIRNGIAKAKGFIDVRPQNERVTVSYLGNGTFDISNQIGGFMVTNESGVTYHYALPVYAYGQESKYFKTGKENSEYQTNTENHPYAYTWYLTAVTGPDYINRNSAGDGTISKDDWGYWVKFAYGKHSDYNQSAYYNQAEDYIWRNPIEGTNKDIDQEVESYSYGKKELYYLSTVETSTHVAYFETSTRLDGRGVIDGKLGGFTPKSYPCNCAVVDENGTVNCSSTCYTFPATTKKLDRIYLLNRSDYDDNESFLARATKAIRTIELGTDYSLAPGTTNSFSNSNVNAKFGKLALKSVKFRGKSGADLIPPMSFQYEKNPAFNEDAYDIWGHYKSDFVTGLNDNLKNLVTPNSSLNVDAWSLSQIALSTGSQVSVRYESDSYSTVGLSRNHLARIKNVIHQGGSQFKVEFFDSLDPLNPYLQQNYYIDMSIIGNYKTNDRSSVSCSPCTPFNYSPSAYLPYYFSLRSKIVEVQLSSKSIIVDDLDFLNKLNSEKEFGVTVKNGPWRDCQVQQIACTFTYNGSSNRWPAYFVGGNIFTPRTEIFGGGLRVRSIKINDSAKNLETSSNYHYLNGVTPYEPFGILPPIVNPDFLRDNQGYATSTRARLKALNEGSYSKLIHLAREIPAPGVIYNTVVVEEEILNEGETIPTKIPGRKVYEFQTFDEEFIKRIGITSLQDPPYTANCVSVVTGQPVGTGCPSGSVPPFRCFDQYGNQIGCGVVPSRALSPLTLKDFSAWVGALKKVTTYGANNQILSEVENRYLHDNKTTDQFASDLKSKFKNQGVVSQVFGEYRIADDVAMPIVSRRDEYPLVSIGQESRDYKTGITTSTENLAFDFYTGNPTKVLSTDGYGNYYVAETIPAYSIPEYSGMTASQIAGNFSGMGLKVNNPKNKNMLTQSAGSLTYKVNSNYRTNQTDANKLALVSANAQTWSDQTYVLGTDNLKQAGIWRMKSSFSFIGGDQNVPLATNSDGLQPMTAFTPFNAWSGNAIVPSGWQKNGEITKYDYFSHALEAKDINGHFAASYMSADQTQVVATAANASYWEAVALNAEDTPVNDYFGGGVSLAGTYSIATGIAHTGSKSIAVQNGDAVILHHASSGQLKASGVYQASIWLKNSNGVLPTAKFGASADGALNEVQAVATKKAGDWYQLQLLVSVPQSYNDISLYISNVGASSTVYFDDFRIHPYQAAMTSYVYNNWGELTHILDNNNLYTEYKYDGMGRLTETFKESFQANTQGVSKISEINYNYGLKNATPFKVTISTEVATNTSGVPQIGGSGVISPTVQVLQGGNATISAINRCDNLATRFYADGKLILNSYGSMVTLYDGAKAYIDGGVCKLTGVLGDHTVKAEFAGPGLAPSILHEAYCEIEGQCYTGMYILYTWDSECGIFVQEPGLRIKSQLPDDIRNTVDNCFYSNNSRCSTKERR